MLMMTGRSCIPLLTLFFLSLDVVYSLIRIRTYLKGIVGVGSGINHSRSTIKKDNDIPHFSFSGSGSKNKVFQHCDYLPDLRSGAGVGHNWAPPPSSPSLSPFSLQKLIESSKQAGWRHLPRPAVHFHSSRFTGVWYDSHSEELEALSSQTACPHLRKIRFSVILTFISPLVFFCKVMVKQLIFG